MRIGIFLVVILSVSTSLARVFEVGECTFKRNDSARRWDLLHKEQIRKMTVKEGGGIEFSYTLNRQWGWCGRLEGGTNVDSTGYLTAIMAAGSADGLQIEKRCVFQGREAIVKKEDHKLNPGNFVALDFEFKKQPARYVIFMSDTTAAKNLSCESIATEMPIN